MVGIYKITSPTNAVYIGQSLNTAQRYRQHKSCKDDSRFYRSIRRHGFDKHKFEVIHELPHDISPEDMNLIEQLFIDTYRELGFEMLNVKEAGNAGRPSEEVKRKISEGLKGNVPSDETRRIWREQRKGQNLGRKFSEETRLKISNALKGKPSPNKGVPHSDEWRKKISEANKGKTYRSGFKLTEEHKAKLRKPKRKAA